VKVPLCKEHDEQLKYYCETCEQLVCMYCTVKDHNGHNHETVEKMAGKHRQELKEITAPVEEMITNLSEAHNKIDKMKVKIRQQGEEVNKEIDQHYDELVQKLMEQKEQLKQQVHDTVSQNKKVLTTQLEEVEYVQAEMLSMKELKEAVEKSSDQEALSAKKQVIDRMQQLTDKYKKLNSQPVESTKLHFVPNKGLLPKFGQFTISYDICNAVPFPLSERNYKGSLHGLVEPLKCVTPYKIVSNDNQMGKPWGIAFCKNGMWAAADNSGHCIYIFDNHNKLQRKIGNRGTKGGEFNFPDVLAFDDDNYLYVVDHLNYRVQKFDLDGNYILQFGNPILLSSPSGIAIFQNKVYVTNYQSRYIAVFLTNGFFCNNVGKEHLCAPYDVAINQNGLMFVADSGHHCIFTLTLDGKLVSKIEIDGSSEKRSSPRCLAVDVDGFVLVSDFANHNVSIFDKEGKLIQLFGSEGRGSGQLKFPHGVAISPNGKIYVGDHGNRRIQIFCIGLKV